MSDIDLIAHYRIGVLRGIPVYMCREDGCWIGKGKFHEPSYLAREKSICIGGGSGEHPALVINEPANCAAIYLRYAGITNHEISARAKVRTTSYMTYCDGMDRTQWEQQLKDDYGIWRSDFTFDRWVAACVGEFIFYMLPEEFPPVPEWVSLAEDD